MSAWYRMSTYSTAPEPVDVVSEHGSFVLLVGQKRKNAKTTSWYCIKPTRAECWQWLIAQRTAERDKAERQLNDAQKALEKAIDEAERPAREDEG